MTLTPEQHDQVSTTIKLIAESMGVTYGRAKEACVAALVGLVKTPEQLAAEDLFHAGPGGICEDCGHLAARHVGMKCAWPERDCPCKGMLWQGQRVTMNGGNGPEGV